MIRRKNRKMEAIAATEGMHPLTNAEYETIVQTILKDPMTDLQALSIQYKHNRTWCYKLLQLPAVRARYDYLFSKLATKAILTRDSIINGIQEEIKKATRPADRLKGWELLGKSLALFTDKIRHEGLPKRIIMRTSTGKEELDVTPTSN